MDAGIVLMALIKAKEESIRRRNKFTYAKATVDETSPMSRIYLCLSHDDG
jgi:hypothetical protein